MWLYVQELFACLFRAVSNWNWTGLSKSESTVKSLFALYCGEGIMHYYNSLKIKEARKLIREGNYNISQISDLLHFDNPQYFSKCFKRFSNMTPREYKASIMK